MAHLGNNVDIYSDIFFLKYLLKNGIFKYVVIIIDFIFLALYIINVILQGTGVIKDKNGFSTISDFYIE